MQSFFLIRRTDLAFSFNTRLLALNLACWSFSQGYFYPHFQPHFLILSKKLLLIILGAKSTQGCTTNTGYPKVTFLFLLSSFYRLMIFWIVFTCNGATYAHDTIFHSNSLLLTLRICSRSWSLLLSLNLTWQLFLIWSRRWFTRFNNEKDQTASF